LAVTFGDQLQSWLFLLVGILLAVAITLLILRKMGVIDYAKAAERNAPLNQGLLADPRLQALSPEEQQRIMAKVRWHPLVLLWLFGSIGGFAWVAIGSNDLLDWINQGPRSAAVVGIAVLVVVLFGLKFLYRWLIGREMRQLPRQ
jgi:hypothetical protein